MRRWIDRRHVLALIAGAGGTIAGRAGWAAGAAPPQMLADVLTYDALGEHRTATDADHATSRWLSRRLTAAGFTTELQPFSAPLFAPGDCRLVAGNETIAAFPGWPVMTTPAGGVRGPLAAHDAPELAGKIALVRIPKAPGGTWDAPGAGDMVMQAARRGPLAVVAVTEGPTGEIVALNIDPARFTWPVPVAIVAGRHAERLAGLAAPGAPATLVLTGVRTPNAEAENVVAHRPGRGPAIVVTTPKTGWFHCAGERATGIAVFLDLAHGLARSSDAELRFVAFAGHELNWLGARSFAKDSAPSPEQVRVWLHIGANAAMQPLAVKDGVISPTAAAAPERHVAANPAVLAAAGAAFTAEAGFAPAAPLIEANAGGELSVFRAGYPMLAGILGANPLFHTPLDRATWATTPAQLETVAAAARTFLAGFAKTG